MFEYIDGVVSILGDDYIVLENNGIGFRINTSKNSIANIRNKGEKQRIYTQLIVKEEGIFLYGFTTKEELDLFKLLLTVSKIGPKAGLSLLSTLKPKDLKLSILSNDSTFLSKAPGIGKKTAERIILELKDKIDDNIDIEEGLQSNIENNNINEVYNALISLGYNRSEIRMALADINVTELSTEDIIKIALKKISNS